VDDGNFRSTIAVVDSIIDSYGEALYFAGVSGTSEDTGVEFFIEQLDEGLSDLTAGEFKTIIAVMARRLWLARRYMAPSTNS